MIDRFRFDLDDNNLDFDQPEKFGTIVTSRSNLSG